MVRSFHLNIPSRAGIKDRCLTGTIRPTNTTAGVGSRWRRSGSTTSPASATMFSPKLDLVLREDILIDRYPDPYGDYEPGNIRWATQKQQNETRRPDAPGDRNFMVHGITLAMFARKHEVDFCTLRRRLVKGQDPLAAVAEIKEAQERLRALMIEGVAIKTFAYRHQVATKRFSTI